MKVISAEEQIEPTYQQALKEVVSRNGWDLDSLSNEHPTMVVFLRHLNCIYCRESLAELGRLRGEIEANGARIAIVHMGTEEQAEYLLEIFNLEDVERFSDPERKLYQAFGLERTTLGQLIRPDSWFAMLSAGIRNQFLPGKKLEGVVGDVLQMPGVFLLNEGCIIRDFKPERADKRPEYLELAAMEC
ncbi:MULTISPECIES: peroxiredoxin-like family protein [unclassified Lentimonas]|uniref:peroxiredoxin-like family protein n=1 Tax=unclassified Lentimonas TaxID=2630993 RepID=UPI00132A4B8E|nr:MULTISPECIES: peroxiredoxin-like family protein [unclassified Lentimonas]CAA6690270.1 Unannotated [Lentimonas sp. CC19]CAA6690798.1 Unannotated [Lentimonas sp. CC10]CAA7068533.1 Unannotated [Lentimonas sp. CC11]